MESSNGRKGIGFTGLLTITFITLKLTGVVAWSWVWVLAPVWISVVILLVLLFLLVVGIEAGTR